MAESTSGRFAKLDIKTYGNEAYHKENEFGVYYTNSVHFATDSPIDYIDRMKYQSKFHTLVEAGSMVHNWVGDRSPSPKAIYKLLVKAWEDTDCVELTISPDKTTCEACERTSSGFHEECPLCNSTEVFWTTRITGYQVRVDDFNSSKLAELHDRKRENILEGNQIAKHVLVDNVDAPSTLEIYTMPSCPNCRRLKQYCDENNIPYVERYVQADKEKEIECDFRAKARLVLEGLEHMPVINKNGIMHECEDLEFLKEKVSE